MKLRSNSPHSTNAKASPSDFEAPNGSGQRTKPIAALYLRVSTDGQSVEIQRADLLAECSRRGWEPVEYTDEGFSGALTERPALDRLMADIRGRHIKAVLCYKLDRLGRSLSHLVQMMDAFESKGVALVVPGQGIDTGNDNPASKLQRQILGAVCEFERTLIRDRVRAGMKVAKGRGRLAGRKPRGLGKGMKFKVERARAILNQVPGITLTALAADLRVSVGTAWRLKRDVLAAGQLGSDCV